MAHDLVIRNGLIVDGTGAPASTGDLAIDGDRISAIGRVAERGLREIDADGATVAPGFIDLHTHMDAQIGWDPALTPASWHGITTVLMGNCGVTFAPVRSEDHATLAAMMQSVEDIPQRAILAGLPWDWNSYGEYLDSIEGMNPALNVCGLVGHAATRFYVMGARAVDEQPSAEEIDQIAALAGASVRDGAFGFSVNRLKAHRLPDGRCIPGTFAEEAELTAIARAVGAHGGLMQSVIETADIPEEMRLMREQLRAGAASVLFSAPWVPGEVAGVSAYQPEIEAIRAEGYAIFGTTQPRSAGFLSGLKTDFLFARRLRSDAWRALRDMDFAARRAAIEDAAFCARLIEEGRQLELAPSIGHTLASSRYSIPPTRSYFLGAAPRPSYTGRAETSLQALADAAGEHPVETWLRLLRESKGEGLFHLRFVNEDLDVLPEYMRAEWVVPGVGDAGAHVSMIMDAGWTSFLLSHWCRDAQIFSLEEAVHMLTGKQAQVLGFTDRGTLRPGAKADVNVFDANAVEERQPTRVTDFPFDAPRLIQRAVGYRYTLVNGAVIIEDDELTGERPGRVLRRGA